MQTKMIVKTIKKLMMLKDTSLIMIPDIQNVTNYTFENCVKLREILVENNCLIDDFDGKCDKPWYRLNILNCNRYLYKLGE